MDNTTLARAALLAPLPAIAFEPVTASAYFRTSDGRSFGDPSWISVWSHPLQAHLHSAFTWASPETVYLTYGKGQALALAGILCAVTALRRTDPRATGRFRWAWRLVTIAYALCLAGVLGEYFSPWTNVAFGALSLPGLLLVCLTSPFLGARMLQQRIGSRVGGWMVALSMPGLIAGDMLGGHLGFALIWLCVAWMLHVRTLLRPAVAAIPVAAAS